MSVPQLGSNALWLSSNPCVSVLELVESSKDHLGESGAVSNSCSDTCAVPIRRWKRLSQTLRSRQLRQQRTKKQREISWRQWHSWKKKQQECKPALKLKERAQTHNGLTTRSKTKMSTREPRDWNEWSFIFYAHKAAENAQLSQILKRIHDGVGSTVSGTSERDRHSVDNKSSQQADHVDMRKRLSSVQLAGTRNVLAPSAKADGRVRTQKPWHTNRNAK